MNRSEYLSNWPVQNILVEAQDGVRVSARYQFSRAPLRYARVQFRHRSTLPPTMTASPVRITDLGTKKIGFIHIHRRGIDPFERLGFETTYMLGSASGRCRYDYEAIILAIQTIRDIHGPVAVAWNLRLPIITNLSDLEWEMQETVIDQRQTYNKWGRSQ